MRQLRLTSADFCLAGETGEPDAYLSDDDKAAMQSPLAKYMFTPVVETTAPKMLKEQKYNG
jgi:hypothetical protein